MKAIAIQSLESSVCIYAHLGGSIHLFRFPFIKNISGGVNGSLVAGIAEELNLQ